MVRAQLVNKVLLATGIAMAAANASSALAATTALEAGWARFSGDSYTGDLKLLQISNEGNYFNPGEIGWVTGISASQSSDPISKGYSLSLDQGLGNGYSVGMSGSKSDGAVDQTSFGGRASTWMRENTLRIQGEYSQQSSTRDPRDYLDTDGIRVRVASDAKGNTFTLRLTHLTTPTTILLGDASQTRSDGRPAALSYGGEVRQYIVKTRSAIHVRYAGYQDNSLINDPTTDYGSVKAQTGQFRWNQRLPKFFMVSLTGRIHNETETPRSTDTAITTRQAIGGTVGLKWRYVTSAWTDDTSEIGVFAGQYQTKDTTADVVTTGSIRSIGIDLRWVI